MRSEPSTVPKGGCKHYIDLMSKDDIEYYTHLNIDDRIDMNLLQQFIFWFGSKEIEMDSFEDKWEHFMDVHWSLI